MKRRIRLTEEDLTKIVHKCVKRALNEEVINEWNPLKRFIRNVDGSDAGKNIGVSATSNGRFSYDDKTDRFIYHNGNGGRVDTGIGYGKGNIGYNWNPFKSTTGHDVTRGDFDDVRRRLRNWATKNQRRYDDMETISQLDAQRESEMSKIRRQNAEREMERERFRGPRDTGPSQYTIDTNPYRR